MARVTVEDCIRVFPNRFELVLAASRRARQLLRGMPPLLDDGDPHKPTVQSLKEIGEGLVTWDTIFELEARERERLEAQ
ncbi:MAG: DNA-directed RNA polymerase subunit omega, partial [Mariprofundaceae bacterium]